ncbi:hypothetical protein [Halostella sp. PRR32]|uniref:hypothetical protein n=1 Tax=Halostella sp. PRR32 TaxID=3098147 RepID=UPI002B1DBC6F|nr:hypothetical protein [Halostella sp. PRR32]
MTEKNAVELVEQWQTGFFFVIGSALFGALLATLLSSIKPPVGGLIGFFGGVALAFLAFSYLSYGR